MGPFHPRNERAFAKGTDVGSSWRPNWVGVIVGLLIAGGALAISLSSYDSASQGGGSFVVLWGAVLAGGAIAVRSLFRSQRDIEAAAHRRVDEANAELVKGALSESAWTEAKLTENVAAGRVLSDGEAASRILAKNRATESDGAARWRANAAAAYAPTVRELKASMSNADWEVERIETTERFRMDRQDAARYWRENSAPHLPRGTALPDHLDPAAVSPAEDWQIAMRLRPIKLDNDGNPVTPEATSVPKSSPTRARA